MGEIIQIHIGQAGTFIGETLWELYMAEHGIVSDGSPFTNIKGNPNALFQEIRSGQYSPRVLFVDLDGQSLNEIQVGKNRKLFGPNQFVKGKEDASNNCSKGYYNVGRSIIDETMNRIRLIVAKCSSIQGFIITNAIGGGTGSGFTSLLVERLQVDYSKSIKIGLTVMPSQHQGTSVVEPYNCVLSMYILIRHLDAVVVFDNESLFKLCNNLDIECPTYRNINRMISQVGSSLTISNRYYGTLNVSLSDFCTNMIPYNRICLLTSAYAPQIPDGLIYQYEKPTVNDLVNYCFDTDNRMVYCLKGTSFYVASTMLFRGDVIQTDVYHSIANLKIQNNNQVKFLNYIPTGFTVGLCPQTPTIAADGDLVEITRSACVISNGNQIWPAISNITHKFDMLYTKRAFIHWFVSEGPGLGEFVEAREELAALEMDYKEVSTQVFDEGFEEEG